MIIQVGVFGACECEYDAQGCVRPLSRTKNIPFVQTCTNSSTFEGDFLGVRRGSDLIRGLVGFLAGVVLFFLVTSERLVEVLACFLMGVTERLTTLPVGVTLFFTMPLGVSDTFLVTFLPVGVTDFFFCRVIFALLGVADLRGTLRLRDRNERRLLNSDRRVTDLHGLLHALFF